MSHVFAGSARKYRRAMRARGVGLKYIEHVSRTNGKARNRPGHRPDSTGRRGIHARRDAVRAAVVSSAPMRHRPASAASVCAAMPLAENQNARALACDEITAGDAGAGAVVVLMCRVIVCARKIEQ